MNAKVNITNRAGASFPVRRMNFDFDAVPEYWMNGSAGLTHFMTALSALFPAGEKFFIDSVRAVRKHPAIANNEALQKEGHMDFDFGQFWMKGQRIATGQANVKAYNRQLSTLISVGKAKPSLIVSHELSLEDAPDAYAHFDARDNGWTKVILKPEMVKTKQH